MAVVRRRTASLPGEISIARGRVSDSAVRRNALGDDREVSRGHSTGEVNRGAETGSYKQRNPQARSGKDRTDGPTQPPSHGDDPDRGSQKSEWEPAEKESPWPSAAVPQGEAADVRCPRAT